MLTFFQYNWQVRDEWLQWCRQLSREELVKERAGGVKSFLYTLFHIIDVEYSWIRGIQEKEDIALEFTDDVTIEQLQALSDEARLEMEAFLRTSGNNTADAPVKVAWDEASYTKNEILHHVIAHEIHHIGQLSVWARELNLKPVSANVIGRKLY